MIVSAPPSRVQPLGTREEAGSVATATGLSGGTRKVNGGSGQKNSPAGLTLWISLCAWLVAGGWLLSALRALNVGGYLILLASFAVFWRAMLFERAAPLFAAFRWRRGLRRFLSRRRLLPMFFAVTTIVIFLRGVAVPPSHDDGLCYRIPRVMHWFSHGGWYWIDVQDSRLNTRGTVAEWLSAPLLLFLRSDRLIFLPNFISHLFLPGLIFSAWRNLGVSRRVAWIWMWLLPSAFCLSLQAGNASNDSLCAFFALVVFAFLPTKGPAPAFRTVALAVLSLALMSGTKPTLAPLVIAFAFIFQRSWRVFVSRPVLAGIVTAVAVLVSYAPTAWLNYMHLHDFIGLSLEFHTPHGGPLAELFTGNLFLALSQNLAPPMLTWLPSWWNAMRWWAGTPFGQMLWRDFQHSPFAYYAHCAVEQAGIGFAVITGGTIIFCLTQRRVPPTGWPAVQWRRLLIFGAVWLAVLFFLLTSTVNQGARLLCAYYPLLLASVFAGRQLRPGKTFRTALMTAGVTMLAAIYCLITLTENPLVEIWPDFNERRLADDARKSALARSLPEGEKTVGLIRAWNERESWLWQPYGTRLVDELPVNVSNETLQARGIRYAVISQRALQENGWPRLYPWLMTHAGARVICLDRSGGWYLVRFV